MIYITKREVSKRLAKQCSEIFLKTNQIPPHISVSEKRSENRTIDLEYKYSAKESFAFQITEELVKGEKPIQTIKRIIATSETMSPKESSTRQWLIGYAPHGRGLCKICKKQIKEKELRIREMDSVDSVLNPELYHFDCFPFKKYEIDSLHGSNKLREEDQKKIRNKMALT